jgi:hypothetical protein
MDPVAVSVKTVVKHDDFKKTTNYTGANASQYNQLFIRAWRPDVTQKTEYQIYFTSFYGGGWRFYNEAYDTNGTKMDFLSIDRHVSSCSGGYGCNYEETMGLNVTREYLTANQNTGIKFKVTGKAGEAVFTLPAAYVKGFLLSTDPSSKAIGATPAGPKPWYQ